MILAPRIRNADTVELSSYLEGVLHEYACGGGGECELEVEPMLVPRAFAWDVAVALAELMRCGASLVQCSTEGGVLLIISDRETASPVLDRARAWLSGSTSR
jgi:hypothetical protein